MGFVSKFLIRIQKFVAKIKKRLSQNCDSLLCWSYLLKTPIGVVNCVAVVGVSCGSVAVSADILARVVPSSESNAVFSGKSPWSRVVFFTFTLRIVPPLIPPTIIPILFFICLTLFLRDILLY